MLAGKSCMGSHHFAMIQNVPMLALAFDLHGLANQSEGHPVAIGIDTHQIVAGGDAGDGGCSRKPGWPAQALRALTLEAVDGPLVVVPCTSATVAVHSEAAAETVDRCTRRYHGAAGGSGDWTVGGVASEILSVSSVSRKGTNARHWSLEQLRMWRAWVRR